MKHIYLIISIIHSFNCQKALPSSKCDSSSGGISVCSSQKDSMCCDFKVDNKDIDDERRCMTYDQREGILKGKWEDEKFLLWDYYCDESENEFARL